VLAPRNGALMHPADDEVAWQKVAPQKSNSS
jgi:hypothetical protein